MQQVLAKSLRVRAVQPLFQLIENHAIHLKIVNERKTRHGDYRQMGQVHQITINANLNKYRFLITLVHEIAHLVAPVPAGRFIKPHGEEWKHTFQQLMLPLLNPSIFPSRLLPLLARHFKNPTASSDTDPVLSVALKEYDPTSDKNYIFEIPMGSTFRIPNGKIFKKGKKRVKRYECLEMESVKVSIFQPNAQVELIEV